MNKAEAIKIREKVRKRNKAVFKLLISYDKFQNAVISARKKLGIIEPVKEFNDFSILGNDYFHQFTDELIQQFNIPRSFERSISAYVLYNETEDDDIPDRNYGFHFGPTIPEFSFKSKMPTQPTREIRLRTYSRMDKQETELAMIELALWQDYAFPVTNSFKVTIPDENLDTNLEIEEFSKGRKRSKKKLISVYERIVNKQIRLGLISKKSANFYGEAVRRHTRNNADSYETEPSSTAEDIGLDYNLNADTVRQRVKRLRDKRKGYFGYDS